MPEALHIRGLEFRYAGQSAFELRVPELLVGEAEQVLLRARSGGGKSTLLALIAGLIDPTRGTVFVGGSDIHQLHGARRDRFRGSRIGMIFQTFHLLVGFSALENVMASMLFAGFPASDHAHRATELLTRLGIHVRDARVEEMSVGQQQRVAVARALACRPALVLADEPTASLDPENAGLAMDLLQEACREQGAALLCVSHDPTMDARFARRESLAERQQEQAA
jgi:putative ABC transport system ATP-binding protein